MTDPFDIAREMERLFEAGKSGDEILTEAQRMFPSATPQEMMHACIFAGELDADTVTDVVLDAGSAQKQGRMTPATSDRADRLRRSLRRLGYDLVDAERRGRFQIRREGSKVDETVGLVLAGVERWIRIIRRASGRDFGEPLGPVVPVAREQPDFATGLFVAGLVDLHAVAVELDLVQPGITLRHTVT
jgi:hypothetical protein